MAGMTIGIRANGGCDGGGGGGGRAAAAAATAAAQLSTTTAGTAAPTSPTDYERLLLHGCTLHMEADSCLS